MRVELHPRVDSDVWKIIEYYEKVAGPELADEFSKELITFIRAIAERPFSFAVREGDVRRANLNRFPYHLLFRVAGNSVRILVVRHHKRHPSVGSRRR
jgi:plasmid stabilization system protein ParE